MMAFNTMLILVSIFVVFGVKNVSTMPKNSLSKPRFNFCIIGDHKIAKVNERWTTNCTKCVCDPFDGIVCEEPTCTIPYKSYHKRTCTKMSEDGCCCEEIGCQGGDGKVYPIGGIYPSDPKDPCMECLCQLDPTHAKCWRLICPPEVCIDGKITKGECCPRCRNGPNCGYPSLEGIDTSSFKPILLSTTALVQSEIDPLMFYKCQCMIAGGTASCTRTPFDMLG